MYAHDVRRGDRMVGYCEGAWFLFKGYFSTEGVKARFYVVGIAA